MAAGKPLPTAEARELQELVVRRAQLVEQRARERMRKLLTMLNAMLMRGAGVPVRPAIRRRV